MNTYYMVTDGHRHYQFQHHHQHYPNHQQNHNPIQQQRVLGSQNNSQRQHHQYQNASPQITKESIHLCNPFEESLITSPTTSSSNSNMVSAYLERHSSTG